MRLNHSFKLCLLCLSSFSVTTIKTQLNNGCLCRFYCWGDCSAISGVQPLHGCGDVPTLCSHGACPEGAWRKWSHSRVLHLFAESPRDRLRALWPRPLLSLVCTKAPRVPCVQEEGDKAPQAILLLDSYHKIVLMWERKKKVLILHKPEYLIEL